MSKIGYIYKITPHNCEEFYIGSTTDMKIRERQHITDSKIHTSKVYIKIRECGGFVMKLLYEYECENEPELRMEEQRCIDIMKPTLNSNRAFTSEEDYIENNKVYKEKNKDVIREKATQYYEKNKDVLLEKTKIYNEKNKDVIREKKKQHYEKNRDVILDKHQKNKDVINTKRREQYKLKNNNSNKREYEAQQQTQ